MIEMLADPTEVQRNYEISYFCAFGGPEPAKIGVLRLAHNGHGSTPTMGLTEAMFDVMDGTISSKFFADQLGDFQVACERVCPLAADLTEPEIWRRLGPVCKFAFQLIHPTYNL
jgi:hypothetical protein